MTRSIRLFGDGDGDHEHVNALSHEIMALLIVRGGGYTVDLPALLGTVIILAASLDCAHCRRQLANQLKHAPWQAMFNDMKAALKRGGYAAGNSKTTH
jgi:hypothetical protein